MSFERSLLIVGLLVASTTVVADEPAASYPSDDFLEYLGSWEGNEEDWLAAGRVSVPPEEPKESGRQSKDPDRTADQELEK